MRLQGLVLCWVYAFAGAVPFQAMPLQGLVLCWCCAFPGAGAVPLQGLEAREDLCWKPGKTCAGRPVLEARQDLCWCCPFAGASLVPRLPATLMAALWLKWCWLTLAQVFWLECFWLALAGECFGSSVSGAALAGECLLAFPADSRAKEEEVKHSRASSK